MKRWIRYAALFQMAMLLAGCGILTDQGVTAELQTDPQNYQTTPAGDEEETQAEADSGSQQTEVMYNDERYICYFNGIIYNDIVYRVDEEDRKFAKGIRIGGLADQSTQEKINDRIKQEALAMYENDLPPYRGIKVLVAGQDQEAFERRVNVSVGYNQDNILSVSVEKLIRSDDYHVYVWDVVPINFNLLTGEEILLPELFADGTDYQRVISDYVSNGIADNSLYQSYRGQAHGNEMYNGFTVLKPFDNVKETQKYIINSTNVISLLLDYETPEFDVDMGPEYIPIHSEALKEMGTRFVYASKYETGDERIYADGFKRSRGLVDDSLTEHHSYGWERSDGTEQFPRLAAQFPVNYLEVETSVVRNIENKELAERMSSIAAQPEARLLELFKGKHLDPESYSWVSYDYRVSKNGHYLMERENYYGWFEGDYSEDQLTLAVYDSITGQQLHLKDCFAPGFDYVNAFLLYSESALPDIPEDDLREALKDPQFIISARGIGVFIKEEQNYLYLYFENVGDENLRLFD